MSNETNQPAKQTGRLADGGRETDAWVDVHLTDPEPDSWEVDLDVERGVVQALVLRLHADGLPGIVNSLLSDADDELVVRVLRSAIEQQEIDPELVLSGE